MVKVESKPVGAAIFRHAYDVRLSAALSILKVEAGAA
jgi:hypothetical protein